MLTDLELIKRCSRRDEAAWEEIIQRHKRKVLGIAYKFTGSFHEAEDLTQDIFLKVYRALDSYDRSQDFTAWLVGVSRNACIDHYRRVKREKLVMSGDADELKNFKFDGLSPQGTLEAVERASMVRRTLRELPDDLRTVLILRDLKGLSYGEIVEQLKLAEGTVKSRIHRGRLELAEKLKGFMSAGEEAKQCHK